MANLKLKGVNKIYPSGTLALYNVNLELSDKEFVAVIGGEKSGKSTLLRVIAGLEEATEGEIFIGDKDVSQVEVKDRDVAMIFQGNTLYPALTVFDNMAFGLRMRKTAQSVIEQRVKTAAEILGLTDVLYRKPKTLNAEQKQKVVLGRAIVREPKLYLFDDPIAGLDADLRAQMRNVIINLQARMNGTFIYATKNVNEALTMATRVVVLREGVVQQIDTPANLYDYPANAYVAFLIGSPTINFVNNAQLVKEDGAVYATLKDVKIPVPESVLARFEGVDKYIEEGKSVIIGIRPEDMTVAEEGIFTATVASTEKVGETTFAECDVNDKLTVVLAVEGAEKGAKVSINADLSRMYIFDGETRLNLLARDGGYKKTKYADADVIPMEYNQEEEVKKTISAQAQPNQPTKSKRK